MIIIHMSVQVHLQITCPSHASNRQLNQWPIRDYNFLTFWCLQTLHIFIFIFEIKLILHEPIFVECDMMLWYYTVYGIYCHMHNSVTYSVLRHMLGYINDQQLRH